MSSIIASIKDLVTSVFEVILSLFDKGFDVVYGLLDTVINFFVGIFKTALYTVGGALEAVGGIGKFLASESSALNIHRIPVLIVLALGNLVVLALIAGGFFGYKEYQRRQGRPVKVGEKTLN